MFRPTEEELSEARRLGIDPEKVGGNAIQLREAIRRAKVGPKRPLLLDLIAKKLGLTVGSSERLPALKRRVEIALKQAYRAKGIVAGVTIRYSGECKYHANKTAEVNRIEVVWNDNIPWIMLVMEGKKKVHAYHALPVALYASVEK